MGNTFKFLLEYNEYIKNIEDSNLDEYIYDEILKRIKFNNLTITEGLIFTYPINKSINILKRRFPELIVELEEEGDIYIENQPPQSIEKYLPIITNLGYFISKYTIDGNNWLIDFDKNTTPVAFYLEPKYDYKVEVPEVLYHVSPSRYSKKISKIGFIPKTGNKQSNHPERIYLTNSLDVATSFGKNLKEPYCIYKIDGGCIKELYSDINLRDGGFYTLQNIKPDFFELIIKED